MQQENIMENRDVISFRNKHSFVSSVIMSSYLKITLYSLTMLFNILLDVHNDLAYFTLLPSVTCS